MKTLELEFAEKNICNEITCSVCCEYIANGERVKIKNNGITHTYAIQYQDDGTMPYARPSMAISGTATDVSIDWTDRELVDKSFPVLRIIGSVNKEKNTSNIMFWRTACNFDGQQNGRHVKASYDYEVDAAYQGIL